MKPSSLMLAAGIAMLPVTGRAQQTFGTANVMVGCRNYISQSSTQNSGNFMQGFCVGMIQALLVLRRDEICEPGVTLGQEVRVVAAYIDSRPARLHEPFLSLAYEALKNAWPCKR